MPKDGDRTYKNEGSKPTDGLTNRRTNHSKEMFGHKSDEVQTSDAFWRSARVLVSELFLKWHSFMFFVLFGRILVDISDFSEIHLVCDLRTDGRTNGWTYRWTDGRTDGPTVGQTDGQTYPLIEMRERI